MSEFIGSSYFMRIFFLLAFVTICNFFDLRRVLQSGDEISLIHPQHPLLLNRQSKSSRKYNITAHYNFIFISPRPVQSQNQQQSRLSSTPYSATKSQFMSSGVVNVREMKLSQDIGKDNNKNTKKISSPWNEQESTIEEKHSGGSYNSPLAPLEVKYELLNTLGKGMCGEVRRARHRKAHAKRARASRNRLVVGRCAPSSSTRMGIGVPWTVEVLEN